MTITSPPRALRALLDAERLRATVAPPPDPEAWLVFLCRRCDKPFRFQGIARCCVACVGGAAAAGVVGSEVIGEVSGS